MEKVSENWKDIGYNRYTAARYVISADGRIMNKNTGHILTTKHVCGHRRVILQIAGSRPKSFCVDELVKMAFYEENLAVETKDNDYNRIVEKSEMLKIKNADDDIEGAVKRMLILTININC